MKVGFGGIASIALCVVIAGACSSSSDPSPGSGASGGKAGNGETSSRGGTDSDRGLASQAGGADEDPEGGAGGTAHVGSAGSAGRGGTPSGGSAGTSPLGQAGDEQGEAGAGPIIPDHSRCDSIIDSTCGGNLVGTWHVQSEFCVTTTPSVAFEGAAFQSCDTIHGVSVFTGAGAEASITFDTGGHYTGTQASGAATLTATFDIAKSCYPGGACEAWSPGPKANITNVITDAGNSCHWVRTATGNADAADDEGTYTTSGGELNMVKARSSSTRTRQYCIHGDTMLLANTDSVGTTTYQFLTR